MQRMYTIFKNVWQRGSHFLPVAFLILSAFFWCGADRAHAENDTPEIVYAKSGSDDFSATLTPDSESEIVPADEGLIKVITNGNPVPFKLSTGHRGQVDISGSLPGLPDGKHRAAIETFAPDKSRLDGRQVLLFVDSLPPVIQLVEPSDTFPRTSSSLLFSVKDPENGSGVVADPEASDLMVDITGAAVFSKVFVLKNNELHLLVTLKFEKNVAPPDYRFNVKVSLKDRAGNKGNYAKEFKTSGLIKPEFISYCKEDDTSILSTLGFLVYPEEGGLKLRVGESRSLSFFTYGNYGKNYKYPPICVDHYGYTAPEFTELSKFWQKEIGRRIEVTGSSENIMIEKQEDKDLTDYRVIFSVSQRSAVSMGEQQSSIQVRFPVAFSLNKAINYCPYPDWASMPKSAFSYKYETRTIPVTLETANEPLKMKVIQDGDKLVATVKFNPAALMDTGASWFEIDGEKHWFETQDDMCTAKGPVREGTVHYKVAAAHKIAVFQDPKENSGSGGRTFFNEGDYIVQMSPPVISGFHYDRAANTLQATIADEGTPPEDLTVKLGLPGYNIDFEFDAITGKLEAVLPFTPLSVLEASLLVTDLARQTTTGRCTVYGNPGSSANPDPGKTTSSKYVAAASPSTRKTADGGVIKVAGNGMHLVNVCEESLQSGIYIDGKFVQMSPGSVNLIRLKVRDSVKSYYTNVSFNRPMSKGRKLEVKLFYNQYDAYWYEPVKNETVFVKISMTDDKPSGILSSQKIYYIIGYYEWSRFVPTDNLYLGLGFSTKVVKNCHVEKRDISSPVIQAVYDPELGEVTGGIHDHGGPLSQLKVTFSAQNDDSNSIRRYREDLPFVFENGHFTSRFEPPARGEYFILKIRATDKAGNVGVFTIKVSMSRSPPEVDIQVETERSDLFLSSNAVGINAYMTAEAADDSKVLPGGTTFWLDGQVLHPFNRLNIEPYQGRSGAFWKSNFHYQGTYAAGIKEGPHLAKFRATDSTGLSAEITKRFEFNLAPVIRDFKVMPGAVLKAGGPVFTAMVIDRGGDMDLSGLSLAVNGNPVDASRLYYDPASGYFAVDGPLELSDGRHVAKLTAIDSRGNQAGTSLRFVRMLQTVSAPSPDDVSDIAIDSVSLMELRGHNGDGKANPGELIRLFISLRSNSEYKSVKCRGYFLAGDEKITVETDNVLYGDLDAGAVISPMKGFDLQIDSDILSQTISDPYETRGVLNVTCGSDQNWSLPMVLPIYRPSVPVDISSVVTVQIEKLPFSTTNSDIQVRGRVTSANSFIEEVIVRVNGAVVGPVVFNRDGGRFETVAALAEGANVIEVEATDKTGAHGFDTGYIHRASVFVPPSIAIATPANGTFFQCNNLIVTGTYDTGSSTLDRMTVYVPWLSKKVGCPVTIIDGSNFSADCGQVTPAGGTYDIEATLATIDGVQAQDSTGIIVGDCF